MAVLTYKLNKSDNIILEISDIDGITHVVDQDKILYGFNYVSNMKFSNIYDCCELGNFVSFTDKSNSLSLTIENYNEILGRLDREVALKIHKKVENYKKIKKLPTIIKLAAAGTLTLALTGFTAYVANNLNEEVVPAPTTLMDASIFTSTVDTTNFIYEAPFIPSRLPEDPYMYPFDNESEATVVSSPVVVDYPDAVLTSDNRIYFTGVKQTGISRNYTNYTFFYNRWLSGTGQRAVADIWDAYGRPSDRGIATINGRYLVAVSTTFGRVGDYIDIVLTNGEVIPCIIADAKSPNDRNYTPYGHRLGGGRIDGVEWESFGAKEDIDISGWAGVAIDYIQIKGISIYNQPIEFLEDENLEWVEDGELEILFDEELLDDQFMDEPELEFIQDDIETEDIYDDQALENVYEDSEATIEDISEDEDAKVYSL